MCCSCTCRTLLLLFCLCVGTSRHQWERGRRSQAWDGGGRRGRSSRGQSRYVTTFPCLCYTAPFGLICCYFILKGLFCTCSLCVWMILNVNLRHITLPHADGFSPGSIRPLSSRDHLNHFNVVYQVIPCNVIYLESCVRIGVLVCHFHTHDDKLPGQSETPQIIVIDSSTPE